MKKNGVLLLFMILIGWWAFKLLAISSTIVKEDWSDKLYAEQWGDSCQDLGTFIEGEAVTATFVILNSGKAPLLIQGVETGGRSSTSIGFSKEPIVPGKSSKIEVRLSSAGKSGIQVKDLTVFTNEGILVRTIRYNVVTKINDDSILGLQWNELIHDFGTIEEGGQYNTTFVLTNTGKDTVRILKHETSGGCTVPTYSKEPLLPNKSTKIQISFNSSGKSGRFTKRVGIVMNVGMQFLTIKGMVNERINDTLIEVAWEQISYDFGRIKSGEKVETVFRLTNLGKETLVIENVQASCGCVVSDWTKSPIKNRQKAEIKVKFNAEGRPGNQEKSITVYTNRGMFTLRLYAIVE